MAGNISSPLSEGEKKKGKIETVDIAMGGSEKIKRWFRSDWVCHHHQPYISRKQRNRNRSKRVSNRHVGISVYQ